VIKFCSWENYFINRINNAREKELSQLKAKKYLDAGCVFFWASTPILMSVLTFITYVKLGNELTPAKVFTSLALFNMLIGPLNAFPWVINGLVQAWVSLKRVQNYLNLDNLSWLSYYTLNESQNQRGKIEILIEIRNGEFDWRKNSQKRQQTKNLLSSEPSLKGINLRIKKGELVGIIGKVGSGKSNLLHSIMAEIDRMDGKVHINPSECAKGFAYVSQDSWIRAGSIKENILFGNEMNPELYRKVTDACALSQDLDLLPRRDETPVGENGVCLSGGQKARLGLARACYALTDKDVYLLDDPLSAVDAHVAKHLFNNCINGLLKDKTRILCTHHFKYLAHADLVIVVDNGKIIQSGRGADIIPNYMTYYDVVSTESSLAARSKINNEITSIADVLNNNNEDEKSDQQSNKSDEEKEKELEKLDDEEMKRQDEEEKEHGVINYRVYKYYCVSVGVFLSFLTVLFLVLMQGNLNFNTLILVLVEFSA
jgi:ATP-binding cassette subfamily C (CFTR/MRP) protein 10